MADTPELHRVTPGNKGIRCDGPSVSEEMDLLDDRWPTRTSSRLWFSLFLVFGSMIEILLAVLQIEIE